MHRDIREMNAKTHPERFVARPIGAGQLDADLYGASQSVNRARKLRKRRIAGPVRGDAYAGVSSTMRPSLQPYLASKSAFTVAPS